MPSHQDDDHKKKILEQFSKQAIPFSKVPGHSDSMPLLIRMSGLDSSDSVLDVACGPGLVACEFAKIAGHVTGIDITEKMIEQARRLQAEKRLANISYSLHHFVKPSLVLEEMRRVCKPGGKVMAADVALPPEKVAAYDHLEKLRDPSHTHALTLPEFETLFAGSGLENIQRGSYGVELELEQQLKASFPEPGDEEKIRAIFRSDLHENRLGVEARLEGDAIHYSVPIAIFVGQK